MKQRICTTLEKSTMDKIARIRRQIVSGLITQAQYAG